MFRPLKDFLSGALKRTGAEQSVNAAVIVEATGPIILNMIPELRPTDVSVISYRAGRVTVAVASPPVGQEVRPRREAILEVLHDTFSQHTFRELRIVPRIDEGEEF